MSQFPVIIFRPIYKIVWPNFWKPLLQRQQTVETVFNLEATFTAAIARCSNISSHCQHKLQSRCGPKHRWLEGWRSAGNNEIKHNNTHWIESDWLFLPYCICLVALTPPPSTSESVRYGLQHHKRSMSPVVAGWKEATKNDHWNLWNSIVTYYVHQRQTNKMDTSTASGRIKKRAPQYELWYRKRPAVRIWSKGIHGYGLTSR